MDFEIGVVAIRFARQHGLQPQLSARFCSAFDGLLGIGHHGGVAFGFRHLDQAVRVGQFVFQRAHRRQRGVQLLTLAHQFLRGVGLFQMDGSSALAFSSSRRRSD